MPFRRLIARASRRIGRRGGSLLFFGLTFSLIGWSYATQPPVSAGQYILGRLTAVMPLRVWAVVWLAVGVLCLAAAAARRLHAVAFGAGAMLTLVWGFGQLAAALLDGIYRAWVGGVVWMALAAFLELIAGWPEDPRSA